MAFPDAEHKDAGAALRQETAGIQGKGVAGIADLVQRGGNGVKIAAAISRKPTGHIFQQDQGRAGRALRPQDFVEPPKGAGVLAVQAA